MADRTSICTRQYVEAARSVVARSAIDHGKVRLERSCRGTIHFVTSQDLDWLIVSAKDPFVAIVRAKQMIDAAVKWAKSARTSEEG